jgi:ribosomal protein S12 methylthiotransferase
MRLMQFQADISAEKLAQRIGNEEVIVIDEVDEEGAIGRSWREAPDIDGVVQVMGFTDCAPGDRIAVLFVLDDERRPVGVLTRGDVVRALAAAG